MMLLQLPNRCSGVPHDCYPSDFVGVVAAVGDGGAAVEYGCSADCEQQPSQLDDANEGPVVVVGRARSDATGCLDCSGAGGSGDGVSLMQIDDDGATESRVCCGY